MSPSLVDVEKNAMAAVPALDLESVHQIPENFAEKMPKVFSSAAN